LKVLLHETTDYAHSVAALTISVLVCYIMVNTSMQVSRVIALSTYPSQSSSLDADKTTDTTLPAGSSAGISQRARLWNILILNEVRHILDHTDVLLTMEAGVPASTPGGGVWMYGGGLSSNGKSSMFFATGNGYASQLNGVPVNGRSSPTALEEAAAIHTAINADGSLNVVNFFMPWEKTQLDGADKDLGTTPLELLPSQFQRGSITRMGVVTGTSSKTYCLTLDDLGGYSNGPNKQDRVVQVTQNEYSVYSGAGLYPLEGGYIYIHVIQYPTHVFKFNCSGGVASFDKVADFVEKNMYVLAVGHGTTPSLNGKPATGLLWTSDVEGSKLRIDNAVPNSGNFTPIDAFVMTGVTKFTRPVFGDGIVYLGTILGYIYADGSPVNLPLNCTSSLGTSMLTRPPTP
jgi:hypothetical protein